ncbi:FecR family protein [Arachidicoccus terrestris]|uniref:FecR family protein n=1 Tax=Arachidicoccus terrestris TaxID=2875539 RepID=UPI001CC44292|nr:FecR domain-containing protein [Arachidicoccus terrestris]UAY55703.1 FecR domain-containing protein [Arachidicoccus terrestris]
MAGTENIRILFEQYLDGQCSRTQVQELMLYFHTEHQDELRKLIRKEIERPEHEIKNPESELMVARVYKRLETQILKSRSLRLRRLGLRIAAAASIILVLSIGAYFLLHTPVPSQQIVQADNILPGGNKAILTLAGGQQIILNDLKDGTVAKQGTVNIIKSADGQVVYDASGVSVGQLITDNTITTPKGGQYEVTLPDHSHVWLNAASAITFPTAFQGTERRVKITGEAYFEVAKDKQHPFIVETATQQVQVLGTHFNIAAYDDALYTTTTLLEGRVKVSTNSGRMTTLNPNQQSVVKGGNVEVKEVIGEDAIAWKEGYFRFNNEPLEEALKKISRWYNVDISYRDEEIKHKTVYGTISRFSDLRGVIQLLDLTKAAKFELQGNKVIVLKYSSN